MARRELRHKLQAAPVIAQIDTTPDVPYNASIGAKMIQNYKKLQGEIVEDLLDIQEQEPIMRVIIPEPVIIEEKKTEIKSIIPDIDAPEIKPTAVYKQVPIAAAATKFVFNDFKAENDMFMKEINERWKKVIESGIYLQGDQCKEMEERIAKLVGRKYCISVGNYTDALATALTSSSYEAPLILPAFSHDSLRSVLKKNMLFVDVDESMTMDVKQFPDAEKGTIIAVHLYGNSCNMKMIKRYAMQNYHIIIEDCSHSIGSGTGQIGDFSIVSFAPGNPLSTIGDGAAILMDDKITYTAMLGLKNSNMGEMECAVVNAKMDKFENLIEKRRNIAGRYKKIVDGIRINSNCIYQQFTVLFNEREKVIEQLKKLNIPFIIPDSKFEDNISSKIISLPCHPFMTEAQIQLVEGFLKSNKQYEF